MRRTHLQILVILVLISLFIGCTPHDPGPPHVVSYDSILTFAELFEMAEEDVPGLQEELSKMVGIQKATVEEIQGLKRVVGDFHIPYIPALGGLEELNSTAEYRKNDYSDCKLYCAYGDQDGVHARIQLFVYPGEIEPIVFYLPFPVARWEIDGYPVVVHRYYFSQFFDLIGYCQFEDHYMSFRFKSADLPMLKDQLRIIPLNEIAG